MEQIYSAVPYYYGMLENNSLTFQVEITLVEPINKDSLVKAVSLARKRYPYFSVCLKKVNEELVLEANDREFAVHDTKECYPIGGEESNGHLLQFYVYDRVIRIDVFHGLTDGRGFMPMLKTLLYYYLSFETKTVLPSRGINLYDDQIDSREWEDPYPKEVKKKYLSVWTRKKKNFILPEAGTAKHVQYCHRLTFPVNSFMEYTREKDGSPGVMFSLLLARAIHKVHPETEGDIIGGMSVDLRKIFHQSPSHKSLITIIDLVHSQQLIGKSTYELAASYRSMVYLRSDEVEMKHHLASAVKLTNRILSQPLLEDKKRLARKIVANSFKKFTYQISYVGQVDYGALASYIDGINVRLDVCGLGVMMEIQCVNDKFHVDFMEESKELIYFQAFEEQLKKHRIFYEVEQYDEIEMPTVLVP